MTYVYILTREIEYEGGTIDAVYSSLAKAKAGTSEKYKWTNDGGGFWSTPVRHGVWWSIQKLRVL